MIIKITRHARDRMSEFAISKEMVKEAIKRGSKFRQTYGFLSRYKFFSVAYTVIGKNIYKIKTVYID